MSISKHIWRNDITGLRAVAVLPVLFFHAFPALIPGGFFGVDVFFVISGYLISGIIFRGLIEGSFSYRDFYVKRIKRILPNLFLVLTFVAFVGYFLLLPKEYRNLGQHIYSSAVFAQNFRLLGEIGYFTEDALRKPLLHLWSLAIEEQFYIVFPILCSLVWRFFRSRRVILSVVILISACSLLACLLIRDVSFVFYFPLTRFWELGAGIMVAYAESYGQFKFRSVPIDIRNVLSCAGAISILAPMFLWTTNMVHPGWVTLVPVLGAVAIIVAGADALVNRTLLSWRPMTFVGLISYSLYLWHWPLLAYIFISMPVSNPILTAATLLMSFPIAIAVYFFVEQPVRRSSCVFGVSTTKVLLVFLVLIIAVGQVIRRTEGIPNRNFAKKFEEVSSIRSANEWRAHDEAEKIIYEKAEISLTSTTDKLPSIVFAGDSHAAHYFPRAKYWPFAVSCG